MIYNKPSILVIYTGGTMGMVMDKTSGTLKPFNFHDIYDLIPTLRLFDYRIDFHIFDKIIDSSNMDPGFWINLAKLIEEKYEAYDGFVIIHGTDTMAYTASALSFILENLNKPVILTGSQLPLGIIRSDGRDNFITAIEIAASKIDETPVVPEVAIYFENRLFRGNRTHKINAENFEAFKSMNYPALAEVGVHIKYNYNMIRNCNFRKLKIHTSLDSRLTILKLFPGIPRDIVETVLGFKGLHSVIIETYGSGNAPDTEWFIKALKSAIDQGKTLINVTQCQGGSVEMGKYETSRKMQEIGVISGYDITTEAAVAKLMFLHGNYEDKESIHDLLVQPISGEITISQPN